MSNGESSGTQAHEFKTQDDRFQEAMLAAVTCGLEHPPLLSVHKDARPFGPQTYVANPVERCSGCSSPCADLVRNDELPFVESPSLVP